MILVNLVSMLSSMSVTVIYPLASSIVTSNYLSSKSCALLSYCGLLIKN